MAFIKNIDHETVLNLADQIHAEPGQIVSKTLAQNKAVSLTLPLQADAYTSPVLFPFFDGLIPEGWLLDVALRNTDISILDRMSLLMICCKDCIGAVSVIPMEEKEVSHV